MDNFEIKKISDVKFMIEKDSSKGMNTNVVMYSSDEMLNTIKKDRTLQQAVNASTLPGIVGNIMLMPDMHEGYGFPVGGVAAFDAENGIISPGAIGFDINCGVRLIKTNLTEKEVRPRLKQLMDKLFVNVPSGVGSRIKLGFSKEDLKKIAEGGAEYVIEKGYGFKDDIDSIEENGYLKKADFSKVSSMAKSRGIDELGTLGAGNHFLEVQKVEKIFDEERAKAYGLFEGQVVIMVHTGSRGFGHQICSDYLKLLVEYQKKNNIKIVDPELSYAEVNSKEADDYLNAMGCAVNYAFANRQIITNSIRKSFEEVFGKSADALGMEILYDVAHNIAKLEEHVYENKRVKVYVHRKGATRAFAKGREEIPKKYRHVGQPVLIPGSMGTASYVLAGMDGAMEETFGSTCHGSGRVMSRHQAIREIPSSKTFSSLESKNIEVRVRTKKLISEEAEWAYKNVDSVVGVVEKAGISKIVSRNVPIGVAKG
jgi:tRNA-splicing ligase RtcB